MNESQLKGMIKFHKRAEKAFKNVGKIENADMARVLRFKLLLELRQYRKTNKK